MTTMTVSGKISSTAVFLDAETKNPIPHPVENKNLLEGDLVQMSREPSTKGRNASGRSWKIRPQKRASSLVKTKVNNQTKTWKDRRQEKLARIEAMELQSELREERRQAKVQKKERRLENERRRAENEFKQAQRSAKELNAGRLKSTLKAMSKKQLRQIKKTRMNPRTGALEYVPAYSK
jgi:rRNA-processing protein CGR1